MFRVAWRKIGIINTYRSTIRWMHSSNCIWLFYNAIWWCNWLDKVKSVFNLLLLLKHIKLLMRVRRFCSLISWWSKERGGLAAARSRLTRRLSRRLHPSKKRGGRRMFRNSKCKSCASGIFDDCWQRGRSYIWRRADRALRVPADCKSVYVTRLKLRRRRPRRLANRYNASFEKIIHAVYLC